MDLNIRIIRHKDFLMMAPDGKVDLEKSKEILLRLVSINTPPNIYDVLLDLRGTTPQMTILGFAQLVDFMIAQRSSFRNKLALLTQAGPQYQLAEFMELYGRNRGFQIGAFDSFEAAMLWLSTITDVPPEEDGPRGG